MYLNVFYERPKEDEEYTPGNICIWDDGLGFKRIPFVRYAFKLDPNGEFKTLYGQSCRKVRRWSKQDEEDGKIYESDITPEMRYLVDNYYEFETPSKSHIEMFIDIEVDASNGLPNIEVPENEITAISYFDRIGKIYTAFVLDHSGEIEDTEYEDINGDKIKVSSFKTEEDLLQNFLSSYLEVKPTIITGWNIDNFDIPYLYNRLRVVFGDEYANQLSPIEKITWNKFRERYFIAGVSCLDYMSLYQKLSQGERISYSLDAIGKLEVGMGKIKYDGSLDRLFKEDKQKFIEYNVHDVRIVVKLDEKLKFIDLTKGVCHKGHVPLEDIYFPSRYLDGAMLTYMKNKGLIAPNRPNRDHKFDNNGDKFSGAYVKEPIPGKYRWVVDLDAASLYPSIIMSLNISPETKVTKVPNWNNQDFISKKDIDITYKVDLIEKVVNLDHDKMEKFLEQTGFSISSNGVLYDMKTPGIIPEILSKWFDERLEYKSLMKKYGKEKNQEKFEYYYMRQYIQKIILNSFYGVLGLPTFRYYDLDNAEAVTTTGVDLIKFAQKVINMYFAKELNDEKDYIIYVDTDSCFFSVEPLVDKRFPNIDKSDAIEMSTSILSITKDVQNYVNKSMDHFSKKLLHINKHRFYLKQELISSAGFWTTKKRYALNIINKEGIPADELEVKGLDVVRTSFPRVFRDFMTEILKDILSDAEKSTIDEKVINLKKSLILYELCDVARPTGVKEISKYWNGINDPFSPPPKGTPVHVKAAINYNDYLKLYGLNKKHAKISDGEKIKWVYLKDNPLNISEMAFRDNGEDPEDLLQFIRKHIDHEKIFESELVEKLKDFYTALNWGQIPTNVNENASKFF